MGDFAGRPNDQGRIKSDVALRAMKAMKYDAMVIGEREMALGDEFILEKMKKSGIPIVESNMTYKGKRVGKEQIKLKKGDLKIGLLGVTLDQKRVGQEEWTIHDPFEVVAEEVGKIRDKVDLVILMSHLGYRQSVALAEHVEGIDVVLVGHQGRRVKTPLKVGGSILAQSGDKGKYLGRIDLSFDRGEKKIVDFSGELISMAPEIPEDEEMAALYEEYQTKVKDMVKTEIKGRKKEEMQRASGYMGAIWCRSCHAEIYEGWNETPHAQAFLTLSRDGEEYNPECIGCHSTGHKEGGFITIDETPTFRNVQCEACHGPSSKHIASKGESPLLVQDESVCKKCHTGDRGEGFSYPDMRDLVH